VIFLMFGLGVAFSLKDLARVRAPATIYVGLAFGSLPRLIWKSVM
jgi:predicted Kef-type K+ transport protein